MILRNAKLICLKYCCFCSVSKICISLNIFLSIYGPEGRGFESLTACHSRKTCFLIQSKGRFFPVTGKGHRSIVHNAAIRCNENLAMLVQIQPDSRQPNRLLIFFVYVHKQSARIFFSWNIVISDCVYFARYIAHPVSHNHHPSL